MEVILADITLINVGVLFVVFLIMSAGFLMNIHNKAIHYLGKTIKNNTLAFLIATFIVCELLGFFVAIIDYCCKYYLNKV